MIGLVRKSLSICQSVWREPWGAKNKEFGATLQTLLRGIKLHLWRRQATAMRRTSSFRSLTWIVWQSRLKYSLWSICGMRGILLCLFISSHLDKFKVVGYLYLAPEMHTYIQGRNSEMFFVYSNLPVVLSRCGKKVCRVVCFLCVFMIFEKVVNFGRYF